MNEERHPGGRTCAGAVLGLILLFTSIVGVFDGILWAALNLR